MSTKKPTPAQLAARKKFAAMAKSGTLAKKRKKATKTKSKKGLKAPVNVFTTKKLAQDYAKDKNKNSRIFIYKVYLYPVSHGGNGKAHYVKKVRIDGLKKPVTKGLTTLCAKTVGTNGRKKSNGQLKKRCIVKKGGKVVCSLPKKRLKT